MDNLRSYIDTEGSAALENSEFTPFVQQRVNGMLERCAQDTEWDRDTSSESFGWFANCVRNNVFNSPALNQNRTVRQHLAGVNY